MKTLTLLTACLLLSITSIAQDTETRDLGSFDGVAVSAGIQAVLVHGNENKIEISASGIDLDKVTTQISRDILKVGIDQKWWNNLTKRNKREVEVTITYDASLEYVSSSSGAFVEADNTILSNDLKVKTSSGASLELDIEASELEVDVSSGAHMELSGSARDIDIDISSGSSLNAYDLEGENIRIDGSSGSTAKVNASNSLNADVSSGASVKYKGSPSKRDFDKSSGGSIRKA